MTYYSPEFQEEAFHCPYCNVYANQSWQKLYNQGQIINEMRFARCSHCSKNSFWFKGVIVVPQVTTAPTPHVEMPVSIMEDFVEASNIVNYSPRGAAALLRLCLQKLMAELGEPGKDINTDIGSLVKKGLSPLIQKSLDIVRVIGNESVHPGQFDMKDDKQTAIMLFELINLIIEDQISRPRQIEELFNKLPEGKRIGISSRDK